ncbi:MAG: tetratricopeptide repeat protein [Polyangiaceae bacterium]
MKFAAVALATLAALAVALAARPAAADPSLWQRARDPRLAEQQLVLNRIERVLGSIGLSEFDPELSAAAIAMSMLTQTLPSCTRNVEVQANYTPQQARFDYLIAGALVDSHADRESDARCILERALRNAPNSPLAADGWFHLTIALDKLGDRAAERDAYVHALDLTWQPAIRANLRVNLAESEMATGDLKGALREYHLALLDAREPDTLSAAYYGLAVALDRSGDLPSALDAARHAIQIQLPLALFPVSSVLDLPGTFFTPGYEIHYYKALGAMAAERQAKDDVARRDALADAAEQWAAYLEPADADASPWAARACLHQARIERELAALNAKLPKITPAKPAPDASTL